MTEFLCLDVGSTWTKAALVSPDGALIGAAQHPTTPPEVLTGIGRVTAAVGGQDAEVLACSSAGGGLRLAVVGQERLVSAEAAYRVALSAGAKVVHVSTGELDGAGIRALRAVRPDVVLLAGGTDGGDSRVLLHNAHRLAVHRIACPIVLAGNAAVREEALTLLLGTRRTVVVTDNVLPDVGELAPGPARAAIRSVFLDHVIGGKGLSRGPRFRRLVRSVTPDAVLTGVGRLAALIPDPEGAVLVVDVGGATTDVYSAVTAAAGREPHAVALPPDRRTVEGDIGVRWSAPGIVTEAAAERLLADGEQAGLAESAAHRSTHVDEVPADPAVDVRLAALAAVLAFGCQSPETKKKKELAALHLHVETNPGGMNRTEVAQ
ncbi:MAG TPA: glutamate mutase L, partial [Pseudonocardiaceae bacterium]|nr:glutamate mutase L [Pseudonocardiaceae bacterium]